jgi:hypothetical protein
MVETKMLDVLLRLERMMTESRNSCPKKNDGSIEIRSLRGRYGEDSRGKALLCIYKKSIRNRAGFCCC